MKRQLFAVLFLLALSSLAVGQASLPVPNIVDHQTSSDFGSVSYQFTENIASADNVLVLAGGPAYRVLCEGWGTSFAPR